jgi:hypothetical protein
MTSLAILVHSTSHALKAEKALKKENIPCKLIPVPRHLSSDCGVCVRVKSEDRDRVYELLEKVRVEIQGLEEI